MRCRLFLLFLFLMATVECSDPALLSALQGLDDADLENVFMWGHSLGSEVSLRTLLVNESIRGATLWLPLPAT